MEQWRSELYHHGILGMKWGKRNGPPYPLGEGDHSSSEKKEGWKKSLGGGRNEEKYDRKKKDPNKTPSAKIMNQKAKQQPKEGSHKVSEKDKQDYRKEMIQRYSKKDPEKADKYKNMSDAEIEADIQRKQNIKKALIATAVVAGASAAVYIAYRNGAFDALRQSKDFAAALDAGDNKKAAEIASKVFGDAFDDVDLVLDKGTTLHRMTGFKDYDLSQAGDAIYTSFTDADRDTYRSMLVDHFETGEWIEATLKATDTLKAPSKEKTKAIIDELMKQDDFLDKIADAVSDGDWAQKAINKYQLENATDEQKFYTAIYSLVKRDSAAAKAIKEKVKAEGYSAIIDFYDKATLADAPLIVLDPDKTLEKVGEQKITKVMKKVALENVKNAENHPSQERAKEFLDYIQQLGLDEVYKRAQPKVKY